MKLVAPAVLAVVLVACAANGEVKVNASTSSDTKTSASGSASAAEEGSSSAAEPPPRAEPRVEKVTSSASTAEAPAAAPASCPLVCYVANKGRVAPAEEQRLAVELAGELNLLRGCGSSYQRPSLTLRFESSGQLSGFGVDAERGNEGACVNTIREHRPAVTYPGPATLRCSERCQGEVRSGRRRR